MKHKYPQTPGTRKWKEDKVPQMMSLFLQVLLKYQYISTLQDEDCKTDSVLDDCFIC